MKTASVVIACLLAIALAACQPITPPPPTPALPTAAPSVAALPIAAGQTSDVRQQWQSSKHASTFTAAADGNNNDCARCHAPLNWMPTSTNDIPATCQSCKFKISTPKPVVQADWKNVGCEQCHKTEKEVVSKQVAWLNTAISNFDTNADPYEAVQSNTELCGKCHRDAFKIDLGKNAHASMTCTNCHNAHSLAANCTSANCHASALKPEKPIAGHDAAHAKVTCVACHDASGLKVGPTDDKTQWVVFKETSVPDKKGVAPFVSHNLQKQVDCARCHFDGNPWGLKKQ